MKNKTIWLGMTVLLVCSLTGCMQSDQGTNTAGGSSLSSGTGSVTASDGTISGEVQQEEAPAQENDAFVSAPEELNAASTDTGSGSSSAENLSPLPTEETAGTAGTENNSVTEETQEDSLSGLPDALEEGTEPPAQADYGWSGTYTNESGETLTVSINDSSSIAFAFANAGLSGTAQLDGNTAIYYGDDHHEAVFDYSGETIIVTVVSEEDYDTSGSPLNGVYSRALEWSLEETAAAETSSEEVY